MTPWLNLFAAGLAAAMAGAAALRARVDEGWSGAVYANCGL